MREDEGRLCTRVAEERERVVGGVREGGWAACAQVSERCRSTGDRSWVIKGGGEWRGMGGEVVPTDLFFLPSKSNGAVCVVRDGERTAR